MSTQIQISPSVALTVGTTPVTSGTNTRMFLQVGGVVQQSSMLTLDDTGVAGSTTANFANTFKRIGNNFEIYGNNGVTPIITTSGGGSGLLLQTSFQNSLVAGNNHGFYIGTGAPVAAMYIDVNRNVSIGSTSPQARLDVRAQGALSTDIAFRVRNSADNYSIITARGDRSISFFADSQGLNFTQPSLGTARIRHYAVATLPSHLTIQSDGAGGSVGQIRLDALDGNTPALTVQRLISGLSDLTGSTLFTGFGTNAATFVMKNALNYGGIGTIPTGTATDHFAMYSADITAGNAAPHFRTEAGNVIKLYQQSSSGITTVAQLVTVLQNLGLLS